MIFSRNLQEHHEHLQIIFRKQTDYAVFVTANKSVLGVPSVMFLGNEVSSTKTYPLPDRDAVLQNCALPKTVRGLRWCLRMEGTFTIKFYLQLLNTNHHFMPP